MLDYQASRLHIAGRDAEQLAQTFGTPCFVLSEAHLVANYRAIAEGFRDAGVEARVRYCAKANGEAGVLRVLSAAGSDLLVSHAAEAERAVAAGFSGVRIAYQRPVLDVREVERALAAGVRHFAIYHPGDVETLSSVAGATGVQARVSLRLCSEASVPRLSPTRWLSGRHGLRGAEAMVAARRVCASRGLTLTGVSFHAGEQRAGAEAYEPMLRAAFALACRIERELAIGVQEIDIGGGFPSPSLKPLRARDRLRPVCAPPPTGKEPALLRAFARDVARRFARLAEQRGPSRIPTLIAEPGRAIASNAGVALTRVHRVEGRWLHLDATSQCLPESLSSARAILTAREPASARTQVVHLSGSTLSSLDVLGLLRRLPAGLRCGDLLVFADAGAYTVARAARDACDAPRVHMLPDETRVERRAAHAPRNGSASRPRARRHAALPMSAR